MFIKINEVAHVEGNNYTTVNSVIIDTRKINMKEPGGKEIYSVIHDCLSQVDHIQVINHTNLFTREIYLGRTLHEHIRADTWIRKFQKVLADDPSKYSKQIYVIRTFIPELE